MIQTQERLYFVKDVIPVSFNGQSFFDIILRERDVYKNTNYDTYIPCQMAKKSKQTVPEVGSIIRCELSVFSKEKNGRYMTIFSLYKYTVEKKAENIANEVSQAEIEEVSNTIGF